MTSPAARDLVLNPAQLRVLRNWSAADRPRKVLPVVVLTPSGPPAERVRAVAAGLVRAHEALRSRLVRGAEGDWRQRVSDPDSAVRDLCFELADLPPGIDIETLRAEPNPPPVDPEERSLRCLAYVRAGRVRAVLLSVSHVFADGVSQLLLYRTLTDALGEDHHAIAEPACQASDFAGDRLAARARRNTEAWRALLTGAPRFCTFTGAARGGREEIRGAALNLAEATVRALPRASRALRVTPYTLWATAASALVSQCTGRHSMVFRTSQANRARPAEFEAVAQLVQPAFVLVRGSARDTFADRAAAVFEASMRVHEIGIYDTIELLRWLDEPVRRRGAAFRPAFDLNYAAAIKASSLPWITGGPARTDLREFEEPNPHATVADLRVAVWQERAATVVAVRATPPVWTARSPQRLLDELMANIAALCEHADRRVEEVPAARVPGNSRLIRGHISGADIDPAMMRELLLSHPRVIQATFAPRPRAGELFELTARVVADRPIDAAELSLAYTERQRWLDGTVVPQELTVSVDGEGVRP